MALQHRLQFALRGSEYAFAIPDNDWEAFEEVAGSCCDIWNGENSLVIPVGTEGELPAGLDGVLEIRDVERVFIHDRLADAGTTEALTARFPGRTTQLRDSVFDHELHPLNLQPTFRDPPRDGSKPALPIPVYEDPILQRVSRLVFGRISAEGRKDYEESFLLEEHRGAAAHWALIEAQVSSLSPLAQSRYLMSVYSQMSPLNIRQLFVVDSNDFDNLSLFWSLRARSALRDEAPPVVGVPFEALSTPEQLRSLCEWAKPVPGRVIKPDMCIVAKNEHREEVASAMQSLGYQPAPDDSSITVYSGQPPEDRQDLEYRFMGAGIGGRLRRGVLTEQLVSLEPGRNIVRFEPRRFATRYAGGRVRLDLVSWPLPLKPTSVTASRVHRHASVDQGVISLQTVAMNDALVFDLTVPGADDVLADFLAERGLSASLSDKGRYASALIGRLGGPQRLEALATEEALSILESLTPISRQKFVQRLKAMLTERYGDQIPAQEELAEMINAKSALLDIPTLSLTDLASQTTIPKERVLDVMQPLIEAGFVRRGRKERCPSCGYADFYPLSELDERLVCHACQGSFVLAIAAGPDEPRLAYQLDPLMARAMDQDLLPVLLTLRHLYSPAGGTAGAFWPGLDIVEIGGRGKKKDCDVLVAQDGNVIVCECKRSAGWLSLPQAEATIALAQKFEANTIFAAVQGEFQRAVHALYAPPRVTFLHRKQLVPARQ